MWERQLRVAVPEGRRPENASHIRKAATGVSSRDKHEGKIRECTYATKYLVRQSYAREEFLESSAGVKRIEGWVDLQRDELKVTVGTGSIQPIQGSIVFAVRCRLCHCPAPKAQRFPFGRPIAASSDSSQVAS
jgi:hypothetical protein